MVKRGPTHVTDTLAVRKILSELPADWLVRSLEERDYGIDLSIEMFSGREPTGKIALIQVKGREKSFGNKISISFPVKTIEYALLFAEPFFVFHTSVADGKTYFVWLQKFVTSRLNLKKPRWRKQGNVTINFPSENLLANGKTKIEGIMERVAARGQAFEYLSALDWLQEHWESLLGGERKLIKACLLNLERLRRCDRFLGLYAKVDSYRPDFAKAKNILAKLDKRLRLRGVDPGVKKLVGTFTEQLEKMHLAKKAFLDEDIGDEVAAEFSDPPY